MQTEAPFPPNYGISKPHGQQEWLENCKIGCRKPDESDEAYELRTRPIRHAASLMHGSIMSHPKVKSAMDEWSTRLSENTTRSVAIAHVALVLAAGVSVLAGTMVLSHLSIEEQNEKVAEIERMLDDADDMDTALERMLTMLKRGDKEQEIGATESKTAPSSFDEM